MQEGLLDPNCLHLDVRLNSTGSEDYYCCPGACCYQSEKLRAFGRIEQAWDWAG